MEITYKPVFFKGNFQISSVFLNGRFAFSERTHFPNRFDFLGKIKIFYLIEAEGIGLESWLKIGARKSALDKNPYGLGYWYCNDSLEKTIEIWKKLDEMLNLQEI